MLKIKINKIESFCTIFYICAIFTVLFFGSEKIFAAGKKILWQWRMGRPIFLR